MFSSAGSHTCSGLVTPPTKVVRSRIGHIHHASLVQSHSNARGTQLPGNGRSRNRKLHGARSMVRQATVSLPGLCMVPITDAASKRATSACLGPAPLLQQTLFDDSLGRCCAESRRSSLQTMHGQDMPSLSACMIHRCISCT